MNLPKKIVRNVWILTIFNISHLKKEIKACREGGIRTLTPLAEQQILSLPCLPVPPQPHIKKKTLPNHSSRTLGVKKLFNFIKKLTRYYRKPLLLSSQLSMVSMLLLPLSYSHPKIMITYRVSHQS